MTRAMAGAVKQVNQSQRGCFLRAVKLTFVEYAGISTIQGFQYLVDPRGNVWTKIIWTAIWMFGILSATILVFTFWQRHITNPTHILIESNHVPIHEFNFPSITFCHINQISEIRTRRLAKTLKLPANFSEEIFVYNILHNAAGFIDKIPVRRERLTTLDAIFASNGMSVMDVMTSLVQPCDDFLIRCRWQNTIVSCKQIFKPSFTYYGNCCTFKLNNSHTNHYGAQSGLSVGLRPLLEKSTISSVYSNCLRVLIHDPKHYASHATIEKVLQIGSESIIRIDATETVCGHSVRDLPMNQRKCVFSNELELKFFNEYSDMNCDTDCLFRQILSTCGCLPFNFVTSAQYDVCNFTQIQCLNENYHNFHENRDVFACLCPQECDTKSFTTTTNRINYRREEFGVANFTIDSFYQDLNNETIIVHFANAKQVFRRQRRDALTNVIYLAANFGGVYSLFVGVSVITLLECIYFATVRLMRRYNQLQHDHTLFRH